MTHLSLQLLGLPEVRCDDAVVALPTQKAAALLAYLTLRRQPATRSHLAEVFWPTSRDPAHASATLRRTLYLLRQVFGAAASMFIENKAGLTVQLGDGDHCDVTLIENALRPMATEEMVCAALAAYRGPFLTGVEIEDAPEWEQWLSAQRVLCEDHYDALAGRRVAALVERGQLAEAMTTANQWMAVRPAHIPAITTLMRTALVVGEPGVALEAFARYRREVAEADDVLDRSVVALAQRARAQRPPSPVGRRQFDLNLPLMGRAYAMAELRRAWKASQRRVPQVALVSGEAGIGKTRLLLEFRRWVEAQGTQVLWGQAINTGGRLPYQPIITALRQRLAAINALDDLLDDVWLSELSRILPEIRERYPDLPMPFEDAEAQVRLFEAVTQAVAALSQSAPLVLVVDDLHWADESTGDLLRFAFDRWGTLRCRVFLVFLARNEETPAGWRNWLRGWEQGETFLRIPLPPLDAHTTQELVERIISEGDTDTFAAWLYQEAQGHPLYVAQLLKTLLERGLLTWQGEKLSAARLGTTLAEYTGLLPESMRLVIRDRLDRLSTATRQIVQAGAVIGNELTPESLVALTELPLITVLDALDDACEHLFLRAEGASYTFVHVKLRDVAYEALSLPRRQALHTRTLAVLESAGAPPATLAYHAERAGKVAEATHHHVAAGDAALKALSLDEAIIHYQAALPNLGEGEEQIQMLLRLGDALVLQERAPEAEAIYHRASLLPDVANVSSLYVDVLVSLGFVKYIRQAPAVEVQVLLEQIRAQPLGSNDIEVALEYLEYYTHHSQDGTFSTVYSNDRFIHDWFLGRLHGVWRMTYIPDYRLMATKGLAHLYAVYRQQSFNVSALTTGIYLGAVHLYEGQIADALAIIRDVHSYYYAQGAPILFSYKSNAVGYYLALALIDWGDYAEALNSAREYAASMALVAVQSDQILAPLLEGVAHWHLGAITEARQMVGDAEAMPVTTPAHPFHVLVMGWVCAVMADLPALEQLSQALMHFQDDVFSLIAVPRYHLIAGLLRQGAVEMARDETVYFVKQAQTSPRFRVQGWRCQALLAEHDGDLAGALELLKEAYALAVSIGLPEEMWTIDATLARLHLARDEHGLAGEAQARAEAVICDLAGRIGDIQMRQQFVAHAHQRLKQIGTVTGALRT